MNYNDVITVTSPNFPNKYPNSQDIVMHIRGRQGYAMVIRFGSVVMESCCDYISLYIGRTAHFEESLEIYKLTGTRNSTVGSSLLDDYWTVHSNMWLCFYSDRSVTQHGFRAWLTLAPLDDFPSTRSNGSCRNSCCENPENSCNPEGCYCDSMCGDNGNCCYDYSSVCTNQVNGTALPPGNGTVLPTNFTEVNLANSTFNLYWSEVIRVTSPNFPKNYNNMENILLRVVAPAEPGMMHIFFGSLDMEPCCDYVRLFTGNLDAFDESTQIFHLTGNGTSGILSEQSVLPNIYLSVHRYVWLQFVTDGSVTHKGFEIYFQYLPYFGCDQNTLFQCMNGQCIERNFVCDGIVDCVDTSDESNCVNLQLDPGDTAVLTSPNYPDNYYNNDSIPWVISTPPGYGVRAHFTDFSLADGYDYLIVNEGLGPRFEESLEVARLTGTSVPLNVTSRGPHIWIRFTTDEIVTARGFRLLLSVVEIEESFLCPNREFIGVDKHCDIIIDCEDGSDERYCPIVMVKEGETATLASYGYPSIHYSQDFFVIWSVSSDETSSALIVSLQSVFLGDPSASLEVISDDPRTFKYESWLLRGYLEQDYFQAADKVFPSGEIHVEARESYTGLAFKMEIATLAKEDIIICGDRLITETNQCDGTFNCLDKVDEESCDPTTELNIGIGGRFIILPTWFSEYFDSTKPFQITWRFLGASPNMNLLIKVRGLVLEPEDTMTLGSGTDLQNHESIIFKLESTYFNASRESLPDIVLRLQSLWLRYERFSGGFSVDSFFFEVLGVSADSYMCQADQIPCSGVFAGCYNEQDTCDGVFDCFDGQDEDGCECPSIWEARCTLPTLGSVCLHRLHFCDGHPQCIDDEFDCTFECDNGRIIAERFVCDGFNDCGDSTDEHQNCACASHQFDCGERCILKNDVCNGYVDCANGKDEEDCFCSSFEFECGNHGNRSCVPFWKLCDGKYDCEDDLSDEQRENCRYCPGNYFQCLDFSGCLAGDLIDDGYPNCIDGSDESEFGNSTLNGTITNQTESVPTLRPEPKHTTASIVEPTWEPEPEPTWGPEPEPEPVSEPTWAPEQDCGRRPAVELHRVTHGQDVTSLGAWPWQISLYWNDIFLGAGSIISPDWIVTAAHCVDLPPGNFTIQAGSLSPLLNSGGAIHEVGQYFQHPLYSREGLNNDIAVIKLKQPLTFTDEIGPVCLPSPDDVLEVGSYVTFTGWGSYTRRYSPQPDYLQVARMPVIPNDICQRNIDILPVLPSMFCMMYPDGYNGLCTGDSGGPVVQQFGGRWTLVGVTSWGEVCGGRYKPAGQTRVSSFMDFIIDTIRAN
nr:uncharacterized protein LOC129270213 [Lytechinus pictus]